MPPRRRHVHHFIQTRICYAHRPLKDRDAFHLQIMRFCRERRSEGGALMRERCHAIFVMLPQVKLSAYSFRRARRRGWLCRCCYGAGKRHFIPVLLPARARRIYSIEHRCKPAARCCGVEQTRTMRRAFFRARCRRLPLNVILWRSSTERCHTPARARSAPRRQQRKHAAPCSPSFVTAARHQRDNVRLSAGDVFTPSAPSSDIPAFRRQSGVRTGHHAVRGGAVSEQPLRQQFSSKGQR